MVQLHIFFFPVMSHGHMLPAIDMANLFSSRGVKSTLITTHQKLQMCTKATDTTRNLGFDISVIGIKFPSSEVGLPEEIESFDQAFGSQDMLTKFVKAMALLQEPLEKLLQEHLPHCLIADMFFPWTTAAAAKFGIPRLYFHGSSTFTYCVLDSIRRNKPFEKVSSDLEPFLVPDLPHQIKLTKDQTSVFFVDDKIEDDFMKLFKQSQDSERTSYGILVNSFYDLEPDYVDHYTKVLGRKAWHVGPFLLSNQEIQDKAQRGKKSAIDADEILNWLNSKNPNSVIYICFGSMVEFTVAQLHEIAIALEISGQNFIWVVRKCSDEVDSEKWFPEGFKETKVILEKKGLIIKGWAPQMLILEHESLGAFVTHCGWNSTLEGVSAGVPMVTWPMMSEQFLNEKLVREVLGIGVGVGSTKWGMVTTEVIGRDAINEALNSVMADDEMRKRAKLLKKKARNAIEEEGGSSYSDLTALIDELTAYHASKN